MRPVLVRGQRGPFANGPHPSDAHPSPAVSIEVANSPVVIPGKIAVPVWAV
jgi:hypothetical protein